MQHKHVNQQTTDTTEQPPVDEPLTIECAEGEVFNNATQTCEPAATTTTQIQLNNLQ